MTATASALYSARTITGIDLDHCLDPATGEIEPWAWDILAQFSGTYAEISPSKKGVKIFVRGTVPGGIKKGNIEIYQAADSSP